jgi:hypothetical protein
MVDNGAVERTISTTLLAMLLPALVGTGTDELDAVSVVPTDSAPTGISRVVPSTSNVLRPATMVVVVVGTGVVVGAGVVGTGVVDGAGVVGTGVVVGA